MILSLLAILKDLPWRLIAYAALAATLFIGGCQYGESKLEAHQAAEKLAGAENVIQRMDNQGEIDRAAGAAQEADRTQRDAKVKTIIKEVFREIEKPVYHECSITDDGMRTIRNAVDTAKGITASEPDVRVPKAEGS